MRNGFLTALAVLAATACLARAANDPPAPLNTSLTPTDNRAGIKAPPVLAAAEAPAEQPAKQPVPAPAAPAHAEPATDAFNHHCCEPCGERLWADAEYLLWWVKDGNFPVPAVLSTTPGNIIGAGLPGNTVLFGPSNIDYGDFSGGRAALGVWLDSDQRIGIDVGGLFLQTRQVNLFNTAQSINAVNTLSFSFVTTGGIETGSAFAGGGTGNGGTISIDSSSRLYSAELNARTRLGRGDHLRLDALVGFRWLQLREDVTIFAAQTDDTGVATASFNDQFQTRNNFYGGQLGVDGAYSFGRWGVCATGKIALGNMHEEVVISGATDSTPGGIFTDATNIGRQNRDEITVVPEVRCGAFFNITQNVSLKAGYTFLYIDSVVRPGDQIDRSVTPQPLFNKTTYWAQGIDLGVALRY
jgi:hypothetical protein